ncbi:hypothetical protein [Massilia glaciei]|uniref:Uncharacterized protein n=1 Tax=Massilia glaciei TaxID=1524097 RepID=A0A2U2HJ82_9BURK|nr:hypothetical protein [Massilia glaciei]PWF47608.1 hypothetical protein C7C56_014775 [Massilia glaciei]
MAERISVDEWRSVVASCDDLQMRSEPHVGMNPGTKLKITLPLGEADSEILVHEQWLPFLRFRRGALITEYDEDFDDPANPIRIVVARVAKQLDAVIGTDVDDDVLEW